jgi:iron complex transport system substrate-binding protein
VEWSYGGNVTKRTPTHRVVSLLPAATDIMLAIGAEDDLVAVSHLCPQPAGRTVPRVVTATVDSDALSMRDIDRAVRESSAKRESLYRLDEATITGTQPTEILTQGVCPVCAVPTVQAEALASAKGDAPECPKLVVLTPRTLADVAADIRKVGDAVERPREAEIVAHDFERRIAKVKAAAKSTNRPRVAVLEWFDPLWASGEWIAEMIENAGGEPVLAGAHESSQRVEWDALVRADPDVIVLAACSMTVPRTQRELPALTSRPEWATLRAVKSGRVFVMNGDAHFSSPGPGLARGVELLGAILADADDAKSNSAIEWTRIKSE